MSRPDLFVLVVVPVLVIESGSKNEDEDEKENEEDAGQLATPSRQRVDTRESRCWQPAAGNLISRL